MERQKIGGFSVSSWNLVFLSWMFLCVSVVLRVSVREWLFGCSSASPRSPREEWLLVFSLVPALLDCGTILLSDFNARE